VPLGDNSKPLEELQSGASHRFADWPNKDVPIVAAGVYTIWDGDFFIYVGMAGRGLTADGTDSPDEPVKAKGLKTRLDSHAGGRRSGDQFCVYVCDRFVIPRLTAVELEQIGAGTLLLDKLTRRYIHERLNYRYVPTSDGKVALALERDVQRGALLAGKPYLNPL
jgi:hypothetical protein